LGIIAPIWRKPLFLSYWAPPALWGLAVLCLSGDLGSGKNTLGILQWVLSGFVALEPAQMKLINFYVRKIGHILAYGILYFLWFRAFRAHMGLSQGRACLSSLGLCLSVSMTDEGHQCFTASRWGCITDVLLDLSGSGLTALLTLAFWTPHAKAVQVSEVTGMQTPPPE
jgi:VanZ family protein